MIGPQGRGRHREGPATVRKVWGEPVWTVAPKRLKLKALVADTPIDHSRGRDWSTVASGRS